MPNADLKSVYGKVKEDFEAIWKTPPKNNSQMADFEKMKTLGRGAFGRVLLVKHKASSDYYALKILSKSEIVKSKQIDNAINEKNILICLKSPFIIKLAYSFKDNSYLYMVMEFVIGGEMFNLLRNMRRFPDPIAKFYGAQVVLAFEYLHTIHIAYRDLKPENLLIDASGYIKVADLGFAKYFTKDKPRTWTICGTPDYMAPEIITNKGYYWAVDWWAFGVLMYEMSAGFPPFMDSDQMKTFERIISGKVRFTPNFNSDLKDLVKNVIQVELSRRFGNLKNGITDIKLHKYFSDIDWMALYNKQIKAPYVPKTKGPADTSCFEKCEEETLKVSDKDKWAEEFEKF